MLDKLPSQKVTETDPAARMFGSCRFPSTDPATYILTAISMWDTLPEGWPYSPEELRAAMTSARAAARHHLEIGAMLPEYLLWILDNVDTLEITFRHFGHWPSDEDPRLLDDLQERLRDVFRRRDPVRETRKWRAIFYAYVRGRKGSGEAFKAYNWRCTEEHLSDG